MNREQLIKLRENLIKYLPEKTKEIEKLAQLFIHNPTMTRVVNISDRDKMDKLDYKKDREYVSTGHGAFGEPEGYFNTWIVTKYGKKISDSNDDYVVVDGDNGVIDGLRYIDLEKLQDEIVEKFRETIIQ